MQNYKGRQEAIQKADEIFSKLGKTVDKQAKEGSVDVLESARRAGIELDEETLKQLRLPRSVPAYSFVPWYLWFPWRALWRHYWTTVDPSGPLARGEMVEDLAITVPVP